MKHGLDSSDKKVTIKKRIINADSIQEFRDILSEVNWAKLYSISNPNDAYEYFLKVFSGICDLAFSLKAISVKKNSAKSLDNQRPFKIVYFQSFVTKGYCKGVPNLQER